MPKPPITVDVTPEMELYQVLRSHLYRKSHALAEFVDNSIQSYRDNEDALKVLAGKNSYLIPKVCIYAYSSVFGDKDKQRSIIIEDNAGGISQQNLQRAVKLGAMNSSKSAQSLSEFGIGMKSAAIWFSNHWEMQTTHIGETESLFFDFNLDILIERSQSSVVVPRTSAKEEEHGTTISLIDSNRFIEDIKEAEGVLSELQQIFMLFLRRGEIDLQFFFDDKKICTKADIDIPTVLTAPFFDKSNRPSGNEEIWHTVVSLNIENKEVKGFVCIRKKGSYESNPGIRLFKKDRLIQGLAEVPYLPVDVFSTGNKYGRQRMYGELELKNFDSDFSKSGFVDDCMKKFRSELKKFLGDKRFLEQGENYRKGVHVEFLNQEENYRTEKHTEPTQKGENSRTGEHTEPTPVKKGKFPHLNLMLSEIKDKANDAKLEKIINEILLITKPNNPPKTPMLIAMGLRSVVEKSFYLFAQRKAKLYNNPQERTPFFASMIKDLQNKKILPGKPSKPSIFTKLMNEEIMTLNLITHNVYIPSDKGSERFAMNYSKLILSLYDD